MKLYTEFEVRKAIELARDTHQEGKPYLEKDEYDYSVDEIVNYLLTPIELPSDSLCINCDESKSTHNVCMDCMIKIGKENIELPSDEEIEREARLYCNIKESLVIDAEERYYKDFQKYDGFKACAKWMREKIGGNNEQQ